MRVSADQQVWLELGQQLEDFWVVAFWVADDVAHPDAHAIQGEMLILGVVEEFAVNVAADGADRFL